MTDALARGPLVDLGPGLRAHERWSSAGWHWRSVVVGGPGGALIYGPLRGSRTVLAAELGDAPRGLAPNHFHHLGLPEWGAAAVPLHASAIAARRIARKARTALRPLDELREHLPPEVTLLEPDGTRAGEVWLRVAGPGGVAWIVGDAFFNLEHNARGAIGLALRATGTAPGLRIGRTFTTLGLADRRRYRRWLVAQLERDRPNLLVPSHGQVARGDDLGARLGELATRRLGPA